LGQVDQEVTQMEAVPGKCNQCPVRYGTSRDDEGNEWPVCPFNTGNLGMGVSDSDCPLEPDDFPEIKAVLRKRHNCRHCAHGTPKGIATRCDFGLGVDPGAALDDIQFTGQLMGPDGICAVWKSDEEAA